MGKIKVLDDNTINQIAAGEVIENPASVLKELLENSRDAGATQITVETKGAGRLLIRVSDNGVGMSEDDLILSVERHATSKLRKAADLTTLSSLGFRGEALASIGAVAKLQIHSAEAEGGSVLTVEGGRLGPLVRRPRRQGTTIEVRSLFYNVPARRAFQKSPSSDSAAMSKVLTLFALSAPDVGLVWMHDGKVEFDLLSNQTLEARIRQVLSESFAQELLPLGEFGMIGKPTAHRPNRLGQYLIVNGRPTQCPEISAMILESYGTRLPPRRFPIFVLTLSLPSEWVDVNVHPQKREIRLRYKEKIQEQLHTALTKQFQKDQPRLARPLVEAIPRVACVAEPSEPYRIEEEEVQEATLVDPLPTPIGLFSNYLLLDRDGALELVDLRRAVYRIRFEQMEQTSPKQSLLLPHTLEVTEEEKVFLMEQEERLASCGMSIRHFGGRTFLVEAIPPWMETSEITPFIQELVEKGGESAPKLLAKRGRKERYRLEEAMHVLGRLMQCQCQETTPDGQPITASVTRQELHEKFR